MSNLIIGQVPFDGRINSTAQSYLKKIAHSGQIPNILISGPPGSGKITLACHYIQYLLRHESPLQYTRDMIEIKHNSKTMEVHLLRIGPGVLLDPSIHGVYDRIILQYLISQVVSKRTVHRGLRILIIRNAHRLTKDAQQALRRTIEKYSHYTRFIFLMDHQQKIIPALSSRLLRIRTTSPSNQLMKEIVNQHFKLSEQECQQLLMEVRGNFKLMVAQAQMLTLIGQRLSIEMTIHTAAQYLWTHRKSQNLQVVQQAMDLLTRLLYHNVEPSRIVTEMTVYWIDQIDQPQEADNLLQMILEVLLGLSEHNKPSFHLEYLCLSFLKLNQADNIA